jgi:hypothetical protein
VEQGKHLYAGESTGNPCQSSGRHRAFSKSTTAIGLIPLGDRERGVRGKVVAAYGSETYEESDSVDISTSRRR